MFSKDLIEKIQKKFPDVKIIPLPLNFVRDPEPQILVPQSIFKNLSLSLKDEFQFDLPLQMTAVDYIKEGHFELVYYLYSTERKEGVVLKSRVPRQRPEAFSVVEIWPGMNFQEREVFDLMGIHFVGHPNLKRIMMWEGFPGHPLRRDYVHVTDKYDSGLEIGTPGLGEKGLSVKEI